MLGKKMFCVDIGAEKIEDAIKTGLIVQEIIDINGFRKISAIVGDNAVKFSPEFLFENEGAARVFYYHARPAKVRIDNIIKDSRESSEKIQVEEIGIKCEFADLAPEIRKVFK